MTRRPGTTGAYPTMCEKIAATWRVGQLRGAVPRASAATAADAPPWAPCRAGTLHEAVAERLRELIIEGVLAPGAHLNERVLCEQLGVSRTPLREAFRVLPARAWSSCSPTAARGRRAVGADVASSFELMGALEALSGELACARITRRRARRDPGADFEMLACHARRDLPAYYRLQPRDPRPHQPRRAQPVLRQTYATLNPRLQTLRFRSNFDDDKWDAAPRRARRDGRGARGARRRRPARRCCASTCAQGRGRAGASCAGARMPWAPRRERARSRCAFHRRARAAASRAACAAACGATCCSTPPSRGRYATDASIYQVEPVGVLVPASDADVRAAFDVCRELRIPMLPRGGGTSQCGQTVGAALVIDHSKHLNRVRRVRRARRATVDRRARHRARHAERVAEAARRCGSRSTSRTSAQARSAAWPATIPAARARSPTATWCTTCWRSTRCSPTARAARFGPEADDARARRRACARSSTALRAIGERERDEIAARCADGAAPRRRLQPRRVPPAERAAVHADGSVNLAHLLVGSEGTLAWTRALTLKLAPLPRQRRRSASSISRRFYRAMECARHIVGARARPRSSWSTAR